MIRLNPIECHKYCQDRRYIIQHKLYFKINFWITQKKKKKHIMIRLNSIEFIEILPRRYSPALKLFCKNRCKKERTHSSPEPWSFLTRSIFVAKIAQVGILFSSPSWGKRGLILLREILAGRAMTPELLGYIKNMNFTSI
jgi:hypothetical protein